MRSAVVAGVALAGLVAAACSAEAAPISWTDWTSQGAQTVSGSLQVGATTVGVTYSGDYSFAQIAGGTNFWSPSAPYLSSAVDNAPPASDIVALSTGGTKNITFSQAIVDPILALVSWNGNVADFGTAIDVLSQGAGYWGSGTFVLNGSGTGFTGSGEAHGAIRLSGTFTSITFTDTTEGWHGFTVGVTALADPGQPPVGVPAPAPLAMLATGLLALIGVRRATRG